jgi:drug/metabolite transporter (DMT)-like permease
MSPKAHATIAAVGSILLWCWSGVCFAAGSRLAGAMPYLSLMAASGSLTVVALQAVRRRPLVEIVALPPRLIVAGFLGVALYTIMFCQAMGMASTTDLAQVNLLNYLWPVWIAVLSLALLKEQRSVARTLIGAAVGFVGVAVSRGLDQLFVVPVSLVPHALAGAGGLLWALYCVLLRRWRVHEEQGGTALHFALCAVMAAGISVFNGGWASWPGWSPQLLFWVLFGGVGPVGLAYHFWEIGMKRGDAHLLGQLAYFTPVGSSLLIGAFFGGALPAGLWLGSLLIVAGAWIVREVPDPL